MMETTGNGSKLISMCRWCSSNMFFWFRRVSKTLRTTVSVSTSPLPNCLFCSFGNVENAKKFLRPTWSFAWVGIELYSPNQSVSIQSFSYMKWTVSRRKPNFRKHPFLSGAVIVWLSIWKSQIWSPGKKGLATFQVWAREKRSLRRDDFEEKEFSRGLLDQKHPTKMVKVMVKNIFHDHELMLEKWIVELELFQDPGYQRNGKKSLPSVLSNTVNTCWDFSSTDF